MLRTEASTQTGYQGDFYASLKSQACQALDRAEFKKAEKLFEWAHVEAKRRNDTPLQERAFCNLAMVANVVGSAHRHLAELRAILGQSEYLDARFLAAYNLALAFDCTGTRRKARFYAQIACQLAAQLDDPVAGAAAAYHLGNHWLGESRLQLAQRSIETSLELLGQRADARNRALEHSTLGYCLTLQGQTGRALALLEASVDTVTRAGCRLYEPAVRLNFGFALLEMEDFERAGDQAECVLRLSTSLLCRKSALYLSGEASSILGEYAAARERFRQLQEEFYPGMSTLADELVTHSTHGLISWLA